MGHIEHGLGNLACRALKVFPERKALKEELELL